MYSIALGSLRSPGSIRVRRLRVLVENDHGKTGWVHCTSLLQQNFGDLSSLALRLSVLCSIPWLLSLLLALHTRCLFTSFTVFGFNAMRFKRKAITFRTELLGCADPAARRRIKNYEINLVASNARA